MVDQFILPIPQAFLKDPETAEFFRALILLLDDLTREDGVIESGTDATTEVAASAETNAAAIAAITNSSPTYTITNATTDRTLNANAAVAGTGIDVADAGPANVALLSDHDALVVVVQELSDNLSTTINDLADKDILGV